LFTRFKKFYNPKYHEVSKMFGILKNFRAIQNIVCYILKIVHEIQEMFVKSIKKIARFQKYSQALKIPCDQEYR
jgi:hypothetical protein